MSHHKIPVHKPGYWKTKRPQLQVFIDQLALDGNVTAACRRSGTARDLCYKWRHADEDFKDVWNKARLIGLEVLKDHAHKLAYEGIKRHTYYRGKSVGVHTEYSEGLLKFLIQQADPTYSPTNRVEYSGKNPFVFEMALHPAAQAQKKQIENDNNLIEHDR